MERLICAQINFSGFADKFLGHFVMFSGLIAGSVGLVNLNKNLDGERARLAQHGLVKPKKSLVVWSCGLCPTMFWAGET